MNAMYVSAGLSHWVAGLSPDCVAKAGEILMTMNGIAQIVFYFVVLLGLAKPLGWYMARVYEGRPCGVDKIFSPVERLIYRLCAVRPSDEMDWKTYGIAMLLFNAAACSCSMPCSASKDSFRSTRRASARVAPDLAFNTAASFATNTNWQAYGGETTLSYLTQMLGLTVQNFVSAATGMAILVALIRGLAAATRRPSATSGSTDSQHAVHPAAALGRLGLLLVSQGIVQTFGAYQNRHVAATR